MTAFDVADTDREIALALRWTGMPSYQRLAAFAEGIKRGLADRIAKKLPLYIMLDGDVAQTLGHILRDELHVESELLVIDGVVLWDFDYIDLGRIRMPSYTVPVTIKSLVFSEDPRGPRPRQRLHHHEHDHDHEHDMTTSTAITTITATIMSHDHQRMSHATPASTICAAPLDARIRLPPGFALGSSQVGDASSRTDKVSQMAETAKKNAARFRRTRQQVQDREGNALYPLGEGRRPRHHPVVLRAQPATRSRSSRGRAAAAMRCSSTTTPRAPRTIAT